MDSKKVIKKYIMPNALVRLGCVVFSLLLVVTLIVEMI